MRLTHWTKTDVRRAARLVVLVLVVACASAGCGAKTIEGRAAPRQRTAAAASTTPADRRAPQTGPLNGGLNGGAGRITNTDACAMRLHDISGALLLYYARTNDLPPTLELLAGAPGVEGPESFVCPASRTPYLYDPGGIFLPERDTYLVAYDPQPSHEGHRWAITVEHPQPGVPLVTKVIALPESFFALRPPR